MKIHEKLIEICSMLFLILTEFRFFNVVSLWHLELFFNKHGMVYEPVQDAL